MALDSGVFGGAMRFSWLGAIAHEAADYSTVGWALHFFGLDLAACMGSALNAARVSQSLPEMPDGSRAAETVPQPWETTRTGAAQGEQPRMYRCKGRIAETPSAEQPPAEEEAEHGQQR